MREEMMLCRKCGNRFPKGALYCGFCGEPLVPVEPAAEETDRSVVGKGDMHVSRSLAMSQEVAGAMICIRGPEIGNMVTLKNDKKVLVGRDASRCSCVVQDPKVSRLHLEITYIGTLNKYLVTDHSSNGTFLSDGSRLKRDVDVYLNPGEELNLGFGRYTFKLR